MEKVIRRKADDFAKCRGRRLPLGKFWGIVEGIHIVDLVVSVVFAYMFMNG